MQEKEFQLRTALPAIIICTSAAISVSAPMNCFTSLGNVLFTFHVQGCSALVIVVVVVVGTLVVVLASFQHDNTSTSPNISGTDSACQPTKQPVQLTDKQTDGPSASGTQLPSCWVLFGFWAIKFVVLQLSVNVHTPTHTHTHNPSAPRCVGNFCNFKDTILPKVSAIVAQTKHFKSSAMASFIHI